MQRFSLRELAAWTPNCSKTAHVALNCVSERLERQLDRLHELDDTNKEARFLQHVHKDTLKLCRHLRDSPALERYNSSDQTVIVNGLTQVRDRHAPALERYMHLDASQAQMDTLLRGRLSIQFLTSHFVKNSVRLNGSLQATVEDAVTEATHVCDAHHMTSPSVDVQMDGELPFVQPWMQHIFVELVKNAMHATVVRDRDDMTPIFIQSRQQDREYIVEVIDNGVGVDSSTEGLFHLGHSSDTKRWDRLDEQQSYAAVRSPMSSLGAGLTVSRLMLEHFGGTLDLFRRDNLTVAKMSLYLDADQLEVLVD